MAALAACRCIEICWRSWARWRTAACDATLTAAAPAAFFEFAVGARDDGKPADAFGTASKPRRAPREALHRYVTVHQADERSGGAYVDLAVLVLRRRRPGASFDLVDAVFPSLDRQAPARVEGRALVAHVVGRQARRRTWLGLGLGLGLG